MKKNILIFILVLCLLFLGFVTYNLTNKANKYLNEINLLQSMKIDEEDLKTLYSEEINNEWLERYREIGIRFMNYVCEYGGTKTEVENLIQQYQNYGEKIIILADNIEAGNNEIATKEIEELKVLAERIELELERLYAKDN